MKRFGFLHFLVAAVVTKTLAQQQCSSDDNSAHEEVRYDGHGKVTGIKEEISQSAVMNDQKWDEWNRIYNYNEIVEENLNFEDYTTDDFWFHLGCEELFESSFPLPIHNESTWMLLRGVYHGVVGPLASSIGRRMGGITQDSGMRVPHVVDHVVGKGRGVFAAGPIRRGDLVWDTRQTALFSTGDEYRRFLVSLSPGLACDVLQWAYVKDRILGLDANTKRALEVELVIAVDLDPGILINDGDYILEDLEEDEIYTFKKDVENIGCVPEAAKNFVGGCSNNFFALRDIEEGEEFLCKYGDFAYGDGWEQFGLQG